MPKNPWLVLVAIFLLSGILQGAGAFLQWKEDYRQEIIKEMQCPTESNQ